MSAIPSSIPGFRHNNRPTLARIKQSGSRPWQPLNVLRSIIDRT
jgi:hypothetical protein